MAQLLVADAEEHYSRRGWHFDKVEASGDTGVKS